MSQSMNKNPLDKEYSSDKLSSEEEDTVSEEEDTVSEEEEDTVSEEELLKKKIKEINDCTGLTADNVMFEFPPDTEEGKIERISYSLGFYKGRNKFTNQELISNALHSYYEQSSILEDTKYINYCAVMGLLLQLIFPSKSFDDLKIIKHFLGILRPQKEFLSFVKLIEDSVSNLEVKSSIDEVRNIIHRYMFDTLGKGCFELISSGINYSSFYSVSVEVLSDYLWEHSTTKPQTRVIGCLFFGFFSQWYNYSVMRGKYQYMRTRWIEPVKKIYPEVVSLLEYLL
jgi:hypothetical protein